MPKASFICKIFVWNGLEKVEEIAMCPGQLPAHFAERKILLLFCHSGIKGIDSTVGHGIQRRSFAAED